MKRILKYFPEELKKELDFDCEPEELRLRVGGLCALRGKFGEKKLKYIPTQEQLEQIILCLAEHSLYSYMEEVKRGFFCIDGGIRIGIAGRAVCTNGKIELMRDFSSVNIRFPRQIFGISRAVLPFISQKGKVLSTLIVSAPLMGKTTLLRDIAREISESGNRVCVIDERCELYAEGSFDVGKRTDVLSACPKAEGIEMALRSLSPQYIVTDEIGREEELYAIEDALNAGVRLIATAHAGSIEELLRRFFFSRLLEMGCINRIVFLSDHLGRGTIERIYDEKGGLVCNVPFLLREAVCEDFSCHNDRSYEHSSRVSLYP